MKTGSPESFDSRCTDCLHQQRSGGAQSARQQVAQALCKRLRGLPQNLPAGPPLGQVLVKETWNVREVVYDSANKERVQVQSRNDGKWYTPITVSELLVMYKERETATNDRGWNYGTYSLENENPNPQLLNNVKMSSCIGCHKETRYDRIFGVQ